MAEKTEGNGLPPSKEQESNGPGDPGTKNAARKPGAKIPCAAPEKICPRSRRVIEARGGTICLPFAAVW